MVNFLVERPILLLFVLLAVGTAVGALRLKRLSLGPAAVLFTALAFSAYDERLALPEVIGTFGLAVFAYAIGITAGPSFFASLRTGLRPVALVAVTLSGLGVLAYALGRALGFDVGSIAGVYAGASNNTPALAAAILRLDGSPEPTVAYSISYLGGILVLLAAAVLALRSGERHPTADDRERVAEVGAQTIAVTRDNALNVAEITTTPHGHVIVSRYLGEDGVVRIADGSTVFRPGHLLHAVGPEAALAHLTKQLGEPSDEHLELDRTELDFRRITLSQRKFFGRTVADLHLFERFGARATRVRRADQDFLATDDFVLQAGDRIRVAAPRDHMVQVSRHLGDSDHGTSDINPLGLAIGLALGLVVGAMPIVIPGSAARVVRRLGCSSTRPRPDPAQRLGRVDPAAPGRRDAHPARAAPLPRLCRRPRRVSLHRRRLQPARPRAVRRRPRHQHRPRRRPARRGPPRPRAERAAPRRPHRRVPPRVPPTPTPPPASTRASPSAMLV